MVRAVCPSSYTAATCPVTNYMFRGNLAWTLSLQSITRHLSKEHGLPRNTFLYTHRPLRGVQFPVLKKGTARIELATDIFLSK